MVRNAARTANRPGRLSDPHVVNTRPPNGTGSEQWNSTTIEILGGSRKQVRGGSRHRTTQTGTGYCQPGIHTTTDSSDNTPVRMAIRWTLVLLAEPTFPVASSGAARSGCSA